VHRPNQLLEAHVRDQLAADTLLDSSRIMVSASDGRVVLSGSVPTYEQSVVAGEDAWRVRGVGAVDNELLVGPAGEALDDLEIAAHAAAALDDAHMVPRGAVAVSVFEGHATLTGTLRRHSQRVAAERSVGRLPGVRGITDNIELTAEPIPTDVVDRIAKALRRSAIVDDSRIEVSNVGQTVYLDGETTSWFGRKAAEDAAWGAPGVAHVVDRVAIVPETDGAGLDGGDRSSSVDVTVTQDERR
jgi:osmotically-inducible protein OsmY